MPFGALQIRWDRKPNTLPCKKRQESDSFLHCRSLVVYVSLVSCRIKLRRLLIANLLIQILLRNGLCVHYAYTSRIVFYAGDITLAVGKIDIMTFIHKAVHFATIVLKQILYFVRFVIIGFGRCQWVWHGARITTQQKDG